MSFSNPSRREFIRAATALGVGAMVAPHARVFGANERVNVAVIGCGDKGGGHIKQLSGMNNVKIVALSDADSQHMNQHAERVGGGVQTYQDFRRALDSKDVDAVVIVAPNHWHALMTVWACQAGKHVYVEKPATHSIWECRRMIDAAKKSGRIVQVGTQHRSDPGITASVQDIQAGMLGKVLWVDSIHFGLRGSIGKVSAPMPVPSSVDYNLWAGPAPDAPVMRRRFHYDWHWQWPYGNGEIGNWGPHRADDICNILGWTEAPTNVVMCGNRWMWHDDGQTPNMALAYFTHPSGIPVTLQIRNLPAEKGSERSPSYFSNRARDVNIVMCENGYFVVFRGGARAYDKDGKQIKRYDGDGGQQHLPRFIDAIQNDDHSKIAATIEQGCLSATMCHMVNASYRVGQAASPEEVKESFQQCDDVKNAIASLVDNLHQLQIDLAREPIILGPQLTFDANAQSFTGDHADQANQYLKDAYREPFVMPEQV
ncbi:Gfo/Idh/MocA family oxidoreductase [Candidatus Sumerlaeota bacterium]|nr:Gfo/Idh/MocA family oxidoreductase [Candidatus Sumerlaeota bacterium]